MVSLAVGSGVVFTVAMTGEFGMAYLGTFEVFRCDYCGEQKTVKSGLPAGWMWVKTGQGNAIRHACPLCQDEVPREHQRPAGSVN